MAYASLERFRDITGRNVLALQQAKEAGKKVVGQYCIYSPLEIALAAGAIPVAARKTIPSRWRKPCSPAPFAR